MLKDAMQLKDACFSQEHTRDKNFHGFSLSFGPFTARKPTDSLHLYSDQTSARTRIAFPR